MLIRDSALYTAGKLLPGLLGMVATGLLTRLLDPASYGLYGLALVVTTFGSAVAFDWLGVAYLRVAQSRGGAAEAAGTASWVFTALVLATCFGAAVGWIGGAFAGPSGAAIAAGLLLMCCYAAFELASRLPVAQFRPGRFLLMNGARAVLGLVGVAGAAWWTRDPAWTACGAALGPLAGIALCGTSLARPRYSPVAGRRLLSFGLPLAAGMALASVANSGVRALLEMFDSAEALGLYTAAFLLVQNTLAVAAAGIASAGYSAAVRALEHGDAEAARRQLTANWSLLLAVLAPMAAGMALTAPQLAAVLVGPRYMPAVAALTPWLAGAGLLAGLRAHGLDHPFQLANRPGQLVWVTAVAAGMSVVLTVVLVPVFGPAGAAVASLVGAASSCALALGLGRFVWPVALPIGTAARVAAACAIMALAVRAVPGGLAAAIVAGAASYAAACVALDVLGARGKLRRLVHHARAARLDVAR